MTLSRDPALRCRDCGGQEGPCSSQVGCAGFEFNNRIEPVNVAYAAGVKDERAQWTEAMVTVWNGFRSGEDIDVSIERLRALIMKTTA